MRIDFFEEFPTEQNLDKARLINFNSTIYLAARSIKEFEGYEKQLKKINPSLEPAYWPILEKSYWISPFSYGYELENLTKELREHNQKSSRPLKVLIDLELPLDKKLILINLPFYFKNRRLIKELFRKQKQFKIEISTAECALINRLTQKKLELEGISYSLKKHPHEKIIMFYPSMVKKEFTIEKIRKYIVKKHKEHKGSLSIALGTIAIGIKGNEPILSLDNFEKEIIFLKKTRIKRAVIFRLGGLNKKYLNILKNNLQSKPI